MPEIRNIAPPGETARIGAPAPEQVLKDLATLMPGMLPESVLPLAREIDRRPEDGREFDANGMNVRLLRCAGVVEDQEVERIFVEVNSRSHMTFTVEAVEKGKAYETFWHPYAHKAVIEERRKTLREFRQTQEEIEALQVAA